MLDFFNSLLFGLPATLIDILQRVQNCSARVIVQASRHDHINPILASLHWLPVILINFKALHRLAPPYLRDLLTPYTPVRPLRSQGRTSSHQCRVVSSPLEREVFQCAAPKLWNSLPSELRHIENLAPFKTALKTLKFKEAYSSIVK